MGIRAKLKSMLNARFIDFLNKRIPASTHQKLNNKNIFILPTSFGFIYLISVFIIFLLGTNYQNNLILLTSYLFVSLFLTSMLYSFFNLSHLQFKFSNAVSSYAGESISVPIIIKSEKPRYNFHFTFVNNQPCIKHIIDKGESIVNVPFISAKRGLHNTGRLKISSDYAFGLFSCWTHLDFNCIVTTYPAKKNFNNLVNNSLNNSIEINGGNIKEGGDDFGELREYKAGESNAQIAWKQLARGQGLLTKTRQEELGSTIWLSFNELPASPIESKLEMLCFLILDHHKHNIPFGLQIGSIEIEPNIGSKHVQDCLSTLACYQQVTLSDSGVKQSV